MVARGRTWKLEGAFEISRSLLYGHVTTVLGTIGYPKDEVRGRLQIVYGLLTAQDGTPVAIEVFAYNTSDPKTVASQVHKLRQRFGITHVCLVGDRGMLTKARLQNDVVPAGLDYLTALRAPEIKSLVAQGAIQLSLFDETDLFEIAHPDHPGERLVAARNLLLAEERVRAHVFLRMLSYYVTFHMERTLAPMFFCDDDKHSAEAARPSPVAPARRSASALNKAAAKRTVQHEPVHSFKSLLADLATVVANKIQPTDTGVVGFTLVTTPTPIQRRAFELLSVSHRLGYA